MARRKLPEDPALAGLRQALRDYLKQTNTTQVQLGAAAKVRQPQISNFLRGRTRSVTTEIERICRIAGIPIHGIRDNHAAERLAQAARHAWDGRPETLEGLAAFIEWVGPRYCSGLAMTARRPAPRKRR
jgi:transcriptional regulator with XRE-family HTH domain